MTVPLTDTTSLHPLALPARADAADAGPLLEYAGVRNESLRDITGRDDDVLEPRDLLPILRSNEHSTRRQWIIREQGDPIGIALLNTIEDGDATSGVVSINLLRPVWGRGIGSAVLAHVEQQARETGLTRLLVWNPHSGADLESIPAPTGFGAVPADAGARFLRAHGFSLEQVIRVSELRLDDRRVPEIDRLRRSATDRSEGYRVVSWLLPTPDAFVEGYARMKQRMSTDAPGADMDMPEEIWDAERLAHHDRRHLDRGRTVLVTAAQHVDSGELCAFTELSIDATAGAVTHQEDTLVIAAHRGHRLGMLIKTSALLAWRECRPDSASVITYNAEENRPMLSINEELGFIPVAYEGAWKKVLS